MSDPLPDHRGPTMTIFVLLPSREHQPLRTRLFVDALARTLRGVGE